MLRQWAIFGLGWLLIGGIWIELCPAQPLAIDELQIDLGEDTTDRLTHPQLPDGDTKIVSVGLRLCRKNVTLDSDYHFYFKVDDSVIYQGNHPELYITIDYYDTGSGFLKLQYDSSDPAPFPDDIYKDGGRVTLSNANIWKQHTYGVTDAYLGNRQNGGSDFRIVKPDGSYYYLDVVTVTIPVPRRSIIGSSHTSGKYYFDAGRDHLNEGAVEIANAGMRVIKLWFTPNDPSGYYMWSSPDWPESVSSLKALAEHAYWKELFCRPFETYILTIFEHRNFRNGFPPSEQAQLEQDFYDLARYLLQTYNNTGKVFVLGHHEGDWHLWGHYNVPDPPYPTATAVQGMIDWYSARQDGVTRARNETAHTNVYVYAAAEVNHVERSMQYPSLYWVTSDVLPHLHMDLVAYSAYETITSYVNQGESTMRQHFSDALDYIASYMPDSGTLDPYGRAFGGKNIFISEYGAPEQQWGGSGPAKQESIS
ncbi:MAG: hypothetical protein ACYTF1_20970, partial [Planctomycetota bacterium]